MAKTLSNTGIAKDQLILSSHVSQSVDAFTGADAYDIVISGSMGLTGSLIQRVGDVRFLDFTQVNKPHVVAYDVASGTLNYIPTASLVDSALTGSSIITASVASNVITFTQGDGSTFNIVVDTGSVDVPSTASLLETASVSLNTITFTQGDGSTFNIVVDTGSSGGTTDTGSLLETASVALNTITFTKGDGSTFPIIVDTGSVDVPSTASLLETASVSLNTITFTKGDGSTFPITVDTGSTTAVDTGSLLETASVALNTITFTKGDGSTFPITVDTGSTTAVDTGSLLETASVALNTITFTKGDGSTFPITVDTGSVDVPSTASLLETASVALNTITFTKGDGSTFPITVDTGSSGGTTDTGSLLETASVSLNTITFTKGDGSTFPITVDTGSSGGTTDTGSLLETASVALNTITFTKGDGSTFPITVDTGSTTAVDTGSLLETASAALNTITFTKGDGSTFDVLIDTGSGGGTINTGSLLETASVSLNTITFTKGDGSTFPITVDTGSVPSTASLLETASAALNTITFTKGDGSTFPITVDTGSVPSTASLLETASVALNTITFTQGDGSTFNIVVDTGSVPSTASLLETASVALNTITFTKGDGSTFPITVDTGSDDDWHDGGTFITSSKDVKITGSLLISGSTVIQGSGSDILTIQNLIGEDIFTVGESDGGYLSEVQNSSGDTLLGVSATETFIANLLRLEGNQVTSGSLQLSGSTHQILGNTVISQGQFDVRSNIIKLGNESSDEILVSGSVGITASSVNIDSSDIQFPSIPSNVSPQVLFYNTATKQIAYGNTSSIAGGDSLWFDGTTYITSSVETRITGALKVNAGTLLDPDPTFTLVADTGSSVAGPVIDLIRLSDTEAATNGNYLGQLKFKGESSTGAERVYAKISGKIGDATDGSEDGLIEFMTRNGGSNKISARLTHTDLKLINDTGIEADGASLFENTVTISGSVLNTGSSFESTVDSFTVSKGDGVNMFVVNATGSKVASGSRIFSSTTISNIGTSTGVLNVDSNCVYFVRQNTNSSMGKISLPTGLTSNEDGLTFEIFYYQNAATPVGSVFEISASDGTGILANTNLANGDAVKLKCVYSNTFDSLSIGTGTGWLITEDNVIF